MNVRAPTERSRLSHPRAPQPSTPPADPPQPPADPFRRFDDELAAGRHWYLAALLAAGQWRLASEVRHGRRRTYLVAGQALDLILLLDRLAAARPDAAPRRERNALRFQGRPPLRVPAAAFARALGPARHKAYLNHFYGVDVEEALLHAVELEQAKAHVLDRARGSAYRAVYGYSLADLWAAYLAERGMRPPARVRWDVWKDFTYWRFRLRLRTQVQPRIASDTRKGLALLRRLRNVPSNGSPDPLRPDAPPDPSAAPTAKPAASTKIIDLDLVL